ncbi:transmembrane domain-containing protein [Cryptosporidium hominis]
MEVPIFSETPLSMQRNREAFVQQIKSLEEVLERVKTSNIRFNRDVMRNVFLSIKPTHIDKCSGKQIKDNYLKRRWELQTMLDTCFREFEALEQLRQQAENNLRRYENVASKYDQEESKLMIQVVSLDLQKEMNLEVGYKVHLECQDQVIETQWKRYQHDKKCVFWNELFSFEIERKFASEANILDIILLDSRSNLQLGGCNVILDELADQRKHELRKEIYSNTDEVVIGSLLISCQWLYSRHILYKSYVREFKQKRDQKMEDLNTYQNELACLDEPFLPKSNNLSLYSYLSSVPDYLANKLDNSLTQFKMNGPEVLYKYVIFISFLLQWIASATRSCYLDSLTTCYIFWCNLGNEGFASSRWTNNGFKFILYSIFISLIIDIFWMNIFFPAWSVSSEEGDLRNFSKVFTFFNFVWKIILFFIIWKSRNDFIKFQQYDEALLKKNKHGNLSLQNHLNY